MSDFERSVFLGGKIMHGKRPTISSLHGVVAAAHPLAAQAGARLLASGGNAFDAAAATAAALNVVEPYMSGLAGMGLATCYVAAEKRVRVLDFVPRIPEKFPVERFRNRTDVQRGALAVGCPGNLAGWSELVRAYGKRSLKDSFDPAIALARDGYPLIEFNVEEINEAGGELKPHVSFYEKWASTYTDGSGRVAMGFILRQPDLARSLGALAAEGPDLLYGGPLGRTIVAHLESLGGCMTIGDFERVKPVWKDPISVSYRDHHVNVPPPPCEGFQFLLALRILEGFDLASLERNGLEHLDQVWRAIRLAAGERIANNNPPPEKLSRLLSEEHVEALRRRVHDRTPISGPSEQWREPQPAAAREHHTTSFSIADREGNVICVTQSLGSPFGSGVVVPGTGLCLNNFLYWTDVNPKSPNYSRPGGELPMCMSPSISIRVERPVLALGTPGSYGILQTQVQALVQYLDFGLPLQEAIEAPRARLWDGRVVEAESRFSPATIEALRARGHDIDVTLPWTMKVGGMQAVAIDRHTGAMTGACDPRRDGYVATG
jgi:gamma-glutamyltranspeptidase/glutathione hydrolase